MKFLRKSMRVLLFGLVFVAVLAVAGALILYVNKDKIWLSAKRNLNIALKSNVEIESIGLSFPLRFPNVALTVKNVSITDSISGSRVFHIGVFKADVDLISIFKLAPRIESVLLEDASLSLVTDGLGKMNFSLLNLPDSSKIRASRVAKPVSLHYNIPVEKIILRNVAISLKDSFNHKDIGLKVVDTEIEITQVDNVTGILVNGPVYFNGLGFNTKLGYFLKDKWVHAHIKATIPANEEVLYFLPSYVDIDGERYNVRGFFKPDIYPGVNIIINTEEAVVSKVLRCLTRNVTEKIAPYHVSNTVHAVITIAGPLMPNEDPKIDLVFWSKDNVLKLKGLPFAVEKMNFEGRVCNHADRGIKPGDANTTFEIKNVRGGIGLGMLSAYIMIEDLINPRVSSDVKVRIDMADVGRSMPELPIDEMSGVAELTMKYKGMLPHHHELSQVSKWRYKGNVFFKDVAFKAGGVKYEHITGQLNIKNDSITIPKGFGFSIAGNKVRTSGYVYNPIEHFLLPDVALRAHIKLESSFFNINSLMVKSGIKRATGVDNGKKPGASLNKILENMKFVVALDFKEALFRKLKVENLTGQLDRFGPDMELKHISLKTSGGSMVVDMKAVYLDSPKQKGTATIVINDIDVKQLFTGMNNFDQTAIESRHLEGIFNAKVVFSTSFGDGYHINPSSMRGKLDFSLKDGHLKDFEPLRNVSRYIFKNRDFTDISFDELTQHATLYGKTLEISEMKIQSNVITLFVNGSYSFDNVVDLKIRVPWFNLKSKEKYLASLKEDQRNARAIHIRAFTKNGKLNFGLGR